MALPTARFHEHERLEFGHVERQPWICLQSPDDVRTEPASRSTVTYISTTAPKLPLTHSQAHGYGHMKK